MNKKFYMIVRDEYGNVIFNHKSDKAKRLIALYNKEAFSTDGNMYQSFYFGTKETNITDGAGSHLKNQVYFKTRGWRKAGLFFIQFDY